VHFTTRRTVDPAGMSAVKGLWPVWAAIGLPLLLVMLNATPIGPNFVFVMIGVPALFFTWACLGVWALIISARRIWRREWSGAMTSAVLPLVILIAALQFWEFIYLCNYGGDVLHFIARRSSYLEEIRATPRDGKPRLLVFNLGGMSWSSRGYVYDESDEVVRTESPQSAAWRERAAQTELSCGYHAEPFPGHFKSTQHWYIASFNC
jgi:hypothetical protein